MIRTLNQTLGHGEPITGLYVPSRVPRLDVRFSEIRRQLLNELAIRCAVADEGLRW
jgi:hypothetical protein